MAEKKLLLGDEAIASERYMPAYRVYMLSGYTVH